jgi:excinuclease UvrABC helicase subunit UvrB
VKPKTASAKESKITIDKSIDIKKQIALLEKKMLEASENLLFEEAAKYRDEIARIQDEIHA